MTCILVPADGPSVSDTAADNLDHDDDLQNDATIMHLKVYHFEIQL